jgi:hypothetical protein
MLFGSILGFRSQTELGKMHKTVSLPLTERSRKTKLKHKVSIKVETPKTFAGAMLGFGYISMLFGAGLNAVTANLTLFNVGLGLIVVSVIVWGFDLVRKGKH